MQASQKLTSVFATGYEKIRTGELRTLIPFLPLFNLNGKPMNLKTHYQFAPLYNTVQAVHTVLMTGRQVGKSYALCSSALLRSMLIPYYHQMIIQPRADQIQRLNSTVYQPLMRSCIIQDMFITNAELSKMALKSFKNGSLMYQDFCFLSADRLRGASGLASVWADECQDIEYEHLAIANETMSASLFWGFSVYTGTPKTTDTTLALLWARSSQAEWVIKCKHCNYYNIPNPEQDLLKMLGNQGAVCAKCGREISPKNGAYVHAHPELARSFPGYHVSQTVHPLHTGHQHKWNRLLYKVNTYDKITLYNEVFGWPYDAATSPLTLAELKKACHQIKITKPEDVIDIAGDYRYITVAVDWSGGGMISDSYTSYAVLGLRANSDVIDVLYGKRIAKDKSPTEEAEEILYWIRGVGADAFAYDNGGAGFARLEIMKHSGLHNIAGLTVCPINYVRPRSGDVMVPRTGQREADLYFYTLDKSRSLAVTVMAIKSNRIRVPDFDDTDEKAYQMDLLALREDPRKSLGNETVIIIVKKPGVPDDFAHAVNFGASQIWDHFGAYPKIGTRYDASILDYDENKKLIIPDDTFGPRGDFDRFMNALDLKSSVVEPELEY